MKLFLPVLLIAIAAAVTAGSAAAGGDAGPPLYPSAVNVQLVRAEALLTKATEYQDEGDAAHAVSALTQARSHMRKAWVAAKYVIDHAPPPVAADGGFPARAKAVPKRGVPKAKARTSGGALPGASPFADEYTTAGGVFNLQHDVAATALGMLDTASGTLLTQVNTTLFAALNARDAAIAYIHKVEPAPAAGAGSTAAHSSGGAIVGGWGSTMSGVAPYVDDEVQQMEVLRTTLNLSTGRKAIVNAAEVQDVRTSKNINTLWPPAPAG
jgi:hypothetical protein